MAHAVSRRTRGQPQVTSESHHETEASLESRNYVLGETSISWPSMPSVAHNHITELGLQLPFGAILQGCVFITLVFSAASSAPLLLVLSN